MSAAVAKIPMDVDESRVESEAEEQEFEPAENGAVIPTTTVSSPSHQDQSVLYSPELLQMYYSRLFPYSFLHRWLSYGESDASVFSRREFSMTLEPVPGEEIYIRYQSFSSQEELQQAVLKRRPTKIDLGAVFSHPPKDHKTLADGVLKPVQRELVFDIDLTDYDDIRRCGCTGAKICGTCWSFMKMAVKVMDEGLKQDFGFSHVAWFYSGRRGIHAWVCDEAARALTDQGRSAVAQYFEVNLGTDKNKDVHLSYPLHPMLQRAYDVLEPLFIEQVLPSKGHGLLASPEQWNPLLETLPEAVREKVTKEWSNPKCNSTPAEKWEGILTHISAYLNGTKKATGKTAKIGENKEREKIEQWKYQTVFRYTYPRLDINVSKMRNHLLKSPFCVHPKTGRVCVPIQAEDIDSFDPFVVPTLGQLMQELDDFERKHQGDHESEKQIRSSLPNWKKTSLKGYFEPFVKKFLDPLQKGIRSQERDAVEREAAMTGDF